MRKMTYFLTKWHKCVLRCKKHKSRHSDEDSSIAKAAESLPSDSEDKDNDSSNDDDDNDDDNEEDDDNKVEDITMQMDRMSLKAQQALIKLPMLMYTWSRDHQELCSIDILLLSGISEENIDCIPCTYQFASFFLTFFFLRIISKRLVEGGSINTTPRLPPLTKPLMLFVKLLTLRL